MERRYKNGLDREQAMLLPPRVDDYVSADNPVRAIDAFVDSLDLAELGFQHAQGSIGSGQPAYAPQSLLKLYLYSYLMRVRSSRLIERETRRNLEVIWLINGLQPSYKTISNFRKDNAKALKAANRNFVMLCKSLELFGGELAAIDGSFFRGNVAKESIFTQARLKKLLKRIDAHIQAYLQELETADAAGGAHADMEAPLTSKLAELKARQAHYETQLAQLKQSGETQYAEVDPDARLLTKSGQSVAGYNVQIATDAKHKLMVHCDVTADGNDTQQLAPVAQEVKAILEVDTLEVVADAGYFNQEQIRQCLDAGITPYVPVPEHHGSKEGERLPRTAFTFEEDANRYLCPQGQYLQFRRAVKEGERTTFNYVSTAATCATCPLRARCLPAKTGYREIYRWEHEALLDTHRQRMKRAGRSMMRTRASMVEHPFGTLKRWCGWVHFLVRGKEKVSGEMNLLMLCYNLKRVMSIFGIDKFREMLKQRAKGANSASQLASAALFFHFARLWLAELTGRADFLFFERGHG
jgi:transposase